jgi:transposase InsO family protein
MTDLLAGFYQPNERGRRPPESLYGSLKMWAHLQRQGVPVARCTVERLMRQQGWRGRTAPGAQTSTTERAQLPGDVVSCWIACLTRPVPDRRIASVPAAGRWR